MLTFKCFLKGTAATGEEPPWALYTLVFPLFASLEKTNSEKFSLILGGGLLRQSSQAQTDRKSQSWWPKPFSLRASPKIVALVSMYERQYPKRVCFPRTQR